MMAIANLILIALVAAAAAGCASAPARFYNLDSTATPDGVPATRAAVMVGPVSIPAAVDRPEFVVQIAPNRVDVDEFNRWDAPFNDAIAVAGLPAPVGAETTSVPAEHGLRLDDDDGVQERWVESIQPY